jgi:hypothetical protein
MLARHLDRNADPLRGALAGIVAGLFASLTMTAFQAGAAKLFPDALDSDDEPATEKAADKVASAATGTPLPEDAKPVGGEIVHYLFGAALGSGYGIAGEYSDAVKAGGGTVFGAGAALLFDDVVVPALDLAPPATEAPPATHAYALASHLVFGLVLEATRRLLRGR